MSIETFPTRGDDPAATRELSTAHPISRLVAISARESPLLPWPPPCRGGISCWRVITDHSTARRGLIAAGGPAILHQGELAGRQGGRRSRESRVQNRT